MKTLILVTLIIFTLSFNGYSQTTKANQLLENKEVRNETFNAIMNNHELMTDFMQAMKGNEHAMMMMNNINMTGQNHQMGMENNSGEMHNNHQMMGNGNGMGTMNNPETMQNMMENMENIMNICDQDSTLRIKMSGIISEHPKMMEMMNMHNSVSVSNAGGMHTMNSTDQMQQQHK